MQNRWSEQDAARAVDAYGPQWGEAVALRTYASRLLGSEPALVLHGGGNASVKGAWRTVAGGEARAIYGALEEWMRRGGARWLRLNVATGNLRAGRFWERMGYSEARRRDGVTIGRQVNTMRVMLKSVAGESLADYLARVPRDRPGSP